MLSRALDVVFPPRCAGCGVGAWPFCDDCRLALVALGPPWCERCGRPCPTSVPRCRDCPPSPVTTARAPFLYAGPARAAIHRLKFSGWRSVASALADAMVAAGAPAADAVTWVPLARRRLAERGYDQARALAVAVGARLDLPVVRLARRAVATAPQARRPGEERRTAMQGAFEPLARPAVPDRVLLVDDVLTTGATAAACAEALVTSGVREVALLTAARAFAGKGPGKPAEEPAEEPAEKPAEEPAEKPAEKPGGYTRAGSQPGLWLPGEPPR